MSLKILQEPGLEFCGEKNTTLKINQACLDVVSFLSERVQLFSRNVECYKCNFTQVDPVIEPNKTTSFIIDTNYALETYFSNAQNMQCHSEFLLEDKGHYVWNITTESHCDDMVTTNEPENMWFNLGMAATIYATLVVAIVLYKFISTSGWFRSFSRTVPFRELEADLGNPEQREQNKTYIQARTRRLSRMSSIDAFRGIAITFMIFVNYGGGDYAIFKHAPWNGLTVADLVFPWFIWIMGVSIALSLRSQLRSSTSRKKIFYHIVKRALILICLGLILNSRNVDKNSYLRIPGVLQRIGVTYFIVASIELIFTKPQRNEQFGPWYVCPDIVDSWLQWLLIILLSVAHVLITFLLPVPGCPTGYLGPGGMDQYSRFVNCTGGAAGYIDRLIFTDKHLYPHPTSQKIFHSNIPYDPEGLLGTLTSVLCAFFGVHAGRVILCFENSSSRMTRWVNWAFITGLLAGLLCGWSQNDGIIPVNKNLWSLSYVLGASCISFCMFTFLYWLVDVRRKWSGSPFIFAGMNAILLYIGHELLKKYFPFRWVPFTNTHAEILAMNLSATTIWLIVAYFLYRHNIFISL